MHPHAHARAHTHMRERERRMTCPHTCTHPHICMCMLAHIHTYSHMYVHSCTAATGHFSVTWHTHAQQHTLINTHNTIWRSVKDLWHAVDPLSEFHTLAAQVVSRVASALWAWSNGISLGFVELGNWGGRVPDRRSVTDNQDLSMRPNWQRKVIVMVAQNFIIRKSLGWDWEVLSPGAFLLLFSV